MSKTTTREKEAGGNLGQVQESLCSTNISGDSRTQQCGGTSVLQRRKQEEGGLSLGKLGMLECQERTHKHKEIIKMWVPWYKKERMLG